MTAPVAEDAITALLQALSGDRRKAVREVARGLLALGLDPDTLNALLAVTIVAAAESQFAEEDAVGHATDTVEALRELFGKAAKPSKRDVN